MALHELAGKPAPLELLVNVPRLVSAYYTGHPDAAGGRLIVETRDVQAFQGHLTATAAELRAGVRSLEKSIARICRPYFAYSAS